MGSSVGVSDTMALISSKLSNIVPFSSCALFLYNEDSEMLRCRFATGVESELIQTMTIRSGHGLTGWVARTRRVARGLEIRARPRVDERAPVARHPSGQAVAAADRHRLNQLRFDTRSEER